MKLRKNDLQELQKSGLPALLAKYQEVKLELAQAILNQPKTGEKVDLHQARASRRSLAQLATLIGNIKGVK